MCVPSLWRWLGPSLFMKCYCHCTHTVLTHVLQTTGKGYTGQCNYTHSSCTLTLSLRRKHDVLCWGPACLQSFTKLFSNTLRHVKNWIMEWNAKLCCVLCVCRMCVCKAYICVFQTKLSFETKFSLVLVSN